MFCQLLLMLMANEHLQAVPTQSNVVLNWFEELKRRAPTGKWFRLTATATSYRPRR